MEIWVILMLAVAADLIIGVFAAPRYGKKLEKLEQELQRERPDEKLELEFSKVLQWTTLALVVWWLVFPYEWVTRWRQWTYPYCTPQGAPPGWDK